MRKAAGFVGIEGCDSAEGVPAYTGICWRSLGASDPTVVRAATASCLSPPLALARSRPLTSSCRRPRPARSSRPTPRQSSRAPTTRRTRCRRRTARRTSSSSRAGLQCHHGFGGAVRMCVRDEAAGRAPSDAKPQRSKQQAAPSSGSTTHPLRRGAPRAPPRVPARARASCLLAVVCLSSYMLSYAKARPLSPVAVGQRGVEKIWNATLLISCALPRKCPFNAGTYV